MNAPLVLDNVGVIDRHGRLLSDMSVTVDGPFVTDVGPAKGHGVPWVGRRVDLRGATVMAGMTTGHFHATYRDLGMSPAPYGYDRPPAYQALIASENLATAVRCGFTTAVSAGAAFSIDPAMCQAIADDLIVGPRFIAGSRELSTTGHTNDVVPWFWEHPATAAMVICDGPVAFARAVREEVRRGARVIKLFVTGGHGTPASKHRTDMSRMELAAAIEAAHERGAMVRGHIANKPAMLMAIDLGIDVVDHGDDIDEEVIAAMAERQTFLVPSLRLQEVMIDMLGGAGDRASSIRADLERMREMLPVADACGVRIVLGDDYGAVGLAHGTYGEELVGHVERGGISPSDVLRWACMNGALLAGLGELTGCIEAGRQADLLIVDGNPADDISVLSVPPRAVMKAGTLVSGVLPSEPADLGGRPTEP